MAAWETWAPMVGAGLGGAMGLASPNQQHAYNQYAAQLNQISQQYNPYINVGEAGLKGYGAMSALNTLAPTLSENRMAATFSNSPYQQQIMQNTSDQMDANAAQTGMLGSTAQQAQLQNALAAQENQFQQQYINRGENEYNRGINSMYNLAGMGMKGLGAQTALEQEAALGTLKGGLAPSPLESGLEGAMGGAMGMARAF
jgi:hypothetical protein